jgi:hypothetical protein
MEASIFIDARECENCGKGFLLPLANTAHVEHCAAHSTDECEPCMKASLADMADDDDSAWNFEAGLRRAEGWMA